MNKLQQHKVKVNVMKSCHVIESVPLEEYVCQIWSLYLLRFKTVKVKVENKQTNKTICPGHPAAFMHNVPDIAGLWDTDSARNSFGCPLSSGSIWLNMLLKKL